MNSHPHLADQLTAMVTLLTVVSSGCTAAPTTAPAAPSATSPPAACAYAVRRDVLPAWARSGFSDPSPSGIPFVVGAHGDIAGILFGYPLTAPPATGGRANKILWTARPVVGDRASAEPVPATASSALRIDARRSGSTEVVSREVPGGPGPSIIDVPRPGCWHLTLTWWNRTDTLDLRYEPSSGT